MDSPRPRARLLGHQPYRLIVLGLVIVAMVLPLTGGRGSAWGNSSETRVTDPTLPTGAFAPQSEAGGSGVVAAATRRCKSIKNKKRRRQCRKRKAAPSPAPIPSPTPSPDVALGPDATLLAAGDIARCGHPGDEATAALLEGRAGTVAALGDIAYESGTPQEFADCYDPSWGPYKARTRPAIGNHDYLTTGAAGYFSYFGSTATPLDPDCRSFCRGYYSYDLGSWHIVVLNTNCNTEGVGGCKAGSPQEQWLRADLAAHPAACTLAYWHYPRYSFGIEGGGGDDSRSQALWKALYEHGAEVVLTGHAHNYQRYAPLNASGAADPVRGIRQFVVGTGGANHTPLGTKPDTAEVGNDTTFGILQLTLHPTSYDWQFLPVAGETFTDSGSGGCH